MSNGVYNIATVVLVAACIWLFILWKGSRRMNDTIKQVARQHELIRGDEQVQALCRAIHLLTPNVSAGIDYIIGQESPGQDPYIAEWLSDEAPRPSEDDLRAALAEVSDVHHREQYAAMRRAEYPRVGEQLDAAYQARMGNDAKQIEIDEKIRQVKEKYPKMDECL